MNMYFLRKQPQAGTAKDNAKSGLHWGKKLTVRAEKKWHRKFSGEIYDCNVGLRSSFLRAIALSIASCGVLRKIARKHSADCGGQLALSTQNNPNHGNELLAEVISEAPHEISPCHV